jgi:hypothetical protein
MCDILVLVYWVALLTICAISATKGSTRVWYSSVKDAQFAPAAKTDLAGAPENRPMTTGLSGQTAASYPTQQTSYPPGAQV